MNLKRKQNRHDTLPFYLDASDEEDTESVGFLAIHIIICLASIIGIWGLFSLVSGLTHSGGLGELGAGWISAVLGI